MRRLWERAMATPDCLHQVAMATLLWAMRQQLNVWWGQLLVCSAWGLRHAVVPFL